MTQRNSVVALVSGGLDSYGLVHQLLQDGRVVHPLYVRCGLLWEPAEAYWLSRWLSRIRRPGLRPLSVLEVPIRSLYGRHWSLTGRGVPSASSPDRAVYLPGRNVLLFGHAAVFAAQRRVSTLATGILAGNPFGDATPRFLTRFAASLRDALGQPIRIVAPLRRLTKARVIRRTPPALFGLTFSCIHPRGRRHCGECNKCAERRAAFHRAKLADPTVYYPGSDLGSDLGSDPKLRLQA